MKIDVPLEARERFLKESSDRAVDFWPFRSRPRCQIGEEVLFLFDGRLVAQAVVSGIEPPGIALWDDSGRFINHWKVFWHQRTLRVLDLPDSPRLSVSLEPEETRPKSPREIAVTELREFVFCPRSWKMRRQGIKAPATALVQKEERVEEGNRFHREHAQAVYQHQMANQGGPQPGAKGYLTQTMWAVAGWVLMIIGGLACLLSW